MVIIHILECLFHDKDEWCYTRAVYGWDVYPKIASYKQIVGALDSMIH